MFFKIQDVHIQSILSVIPKKKNKVKEDDHVKRVKRVIGVKSSRRAQDHVTTVDLFIEASHKIIKKNSIKKDKINCLICVTQTPDYLMPSCSNIIHQKLKLKKDCAVFDINLGCSGYVYGLWVAMTIMRNCKGYGLLLVGDTMSKTINDKDFSNQLLFGDGSSATLLEKKRGLKSFFKIGSGNTGFDKLILKGSGFRDKIGKPEFQMDGKEVFSFALSNVPVLVREVLAQSKFDSKDINYYIFHQANKMMLDKIYDELGIVHKKRLFSIQEYGNTSSASIPITICKFNHSGRNNCLIAGFGAGFSFAASIVNLSKTNISKIVYYEK